MFAGTGPGHTRRAREHHACPRGRVIGPHSDGRERNGPLPTGCAIGEVLGFVIGTALGWSDLQTIVLAVVLAFGFGYAFTIAPVMQSGLTFAAALPIALAADTLSITTMEIVDNAVILVIPGAMDAGLTSPLFWGSLALALAVAFVVTVPVNRWLIARGKGHAVVHDLHGGHAGHLGHGHTGSVQRTED